MFVETLSATLSSCVYVSLVFGSWYYLFVKEIPFVFCLFRLLVILISGGSQSSPLWWRDQRQRHICKSSVKTPRSIERAAELSGVTQINLIKCCNTATPILHLPHTQSLSCSLGGCVADNYTSNSSQFMSKYTKTNNIGSALIFKVFCFWIFVHGYIFSFRLSVWTFYFIYLFILTHWRFLPFKPNTWCWGLSPRVSVVTSAKASISDTCQASLESKLPS